MDANQIRLGETGLEELIEWLRQNNQPQSLEVLTYHYLSILRDKVMGNREPEPAAS